MSTVSFAVLSRSSRYVRIVGQYFDLARELGFGGSRQYRSDKALARQWTPAARRTVYTDIWAQAAQMVGAEYRELGNDFTLMTRNEARTVARFHNVQLDDPVALELALDKALVHRLLREADVVVPVNREFIPTDPRPALDFLRGTEEPVVIKPASGTRGGFGVTCAVDSVVDFHRAILHASRFADRLLIEQSARGEEYRFLFLDGQLLDVIKRSAPHVVGDGHSSVAELISMENQRRASNKGWSGTSFLDIDLDCVLTLDRSQLTLRSRPAAGVAVQVKSAANTNAAEDNRTIDRRAVSEALVAEARRAVSTLGLRLAGVDLITPDISQSLTQAGGAVIEVNSAPGLHYHYLVADTGHATKVAIPVLQTLLALPTR